MKKFIISGSGYSILAATALILMSNRGAFKEEDKIKEFEISENGNYSTGDKKLSTLLEEAYGDRQQPYVLRQLDTTLEGEADQDTARVNRLFKFATVDVTPGELQQAVSSDTFGYEFYQRISKETVWLDQQAQSGLTAEHAGTDWWKAGKKKAKKDEKSGTVDASKTADTKSKTVNKNEKQPAGAKGAGEGEQSKSALAGTQGQGTQGTDTTATGAGPTDTGPGNTLGDKLGEKNEKADFEPKDLDKAFDSPEEAKEKGSDAAAKAADGIDPEKEDKK